MLDTHHSDFDAEPPTLPNRHAADSDGDMDYDGTTTPPPPDPTQPPPDYPGGGGPDGHLPAPGDGDQEG